MKIIIPMTGYGSRFVAAGYQELKPFIKVQGKSILQWILDGMYPGESNILFVCRQEHLEKIPGMKKALLEISPSAEVYAIKEWMKKGPVYDVLRAAGQIPDMEPCIINYCDFYMYWDWASFKENVRERGCDGCVPCYTGFHPHLLPAKNVYASCECSDYVFLQISDFNCHALYCNSFSESGAYKNRSHQFTARRI